MYKSPEAKTLFHEVCSPNFCLNFAWVRGVNPVTDVLDKLWLQK